MRKGIKQSLGCQMLDDDDYLGEPRRHGGTVNRRGLNLNTRVRYHRYRDLLLIEEFCYLLIRDLFSFLLLACFHLVAHPVGNTEQNARYLLTILTRREREARILESSHLSPM